MAIKPPPFIVEAGRGNPPDIDGLSLEDASEVDAANAKARLQEIGFQWHEENHRRQKWETHLRVGLAVALMLMFLLINIGVGLLVYSTSQAELKLLQAKAMTSADRSITPGVFMTLIGASVVQVGAGIATILTYLFPKAAERNSDLSR